MPVAAIAIPSGTGMICTETVSSVYNIALELAEAGVACKLEMEACALVYSARWDILKRCAENGWDYVFWHDDDMLVSAGGAVAMYHGLIQNGFTGITALTSTRSRTIPRIPVCWGKDEGFLDRPPDGFYEGIKPCNGFGLGISLFDVKKTMECLRKGGFGMEREDHNPFLPFHLGGEKGKVLGEDLAFCKRLRDQGATFGVHCDVRPAHFLQMEMNADIVFHMFSDIDHAALEERMEPQDVAQVDLSGLQRP